MHPQLDAAAPEAWPTTPLPTVLWLHGRTVTKELDPGRYQRWLAAGMAAIAMDLPGHGERLEAQLQAPGSLAELVDRCAPELDVVADWAQRNGCSLPDRWGIGGMSAGGMVAACRLCQSHRFSVLLLESSTGDLLSLPGAAQRGGQRLAELSPLDHLHDWRDIPTLALHSAKDEVVPVAGTRRFIDALRVRSTHPDRVTLHEWDSTGAPAEHVGFGRVAAEAKELGTRFLQRWLA